MSIQAVAWALEQDVKDPAAKMVLISLANAYNQQRHRCFPTVRQIMIEAGISEMGARRKLKLLVEMGLVRVEKSFAEDGRQQANEYLFPTFGEGTKLIGGGYQPDRGEGTKGDRGEGTSCDTPLKEPEEIPEEGSLGASAPSEPAVPDHFEEFWATYPKREGPNPKKPARQRFTRLVANGADPKAIISAAKVLSQHHRTPTRFCPQAVTWLNQERFADAEMKAEGERKKFVLKRPETDEEWQNALRLARLRHEWWDVYGPAPDDPNTFVPKHLLVRKDADYWHVRKAS